MKNENIIVHKVFLVNVVFLQYSFCSTLLRPILLGSGSGSDFSRPDPQDPDPVKMGPEMQH